VYTLNPDVLVCQRTHLSNHPSSQLTDAFVPVSLSAEVFSTLRLLVLLLFLLVLLYPPRCCVISALPFLFYLSFSLTSFFVVVLFLFLFLCLFLSLDCSPTQNDQVTIDCLTRPSLDACMSSHRQPTSSLSCLLMKTYKRMKQEQQQEERKEGTEACRRRKEGQEKRREDAQIEIIKQEET